MAMSRRRSRLRSKSCSGKIPWRPIGGKSAGRTSPAWPETGESAKTSMRKGAHAMMKILAGAMLVAALLPVGAQAQTDHAAAQKQFNSVCAGCHGEGGAGGDRAPALSNNIVLRTMTETQIHDLIKSGTPGGMP